MNKLSLAALTAFLASGTANYARAATPEALDRLVGYARTACLVGTQYDLKLDESGNLSFRNIRRPGEEVRIDTTARASSGASAIFDQQLRVIADKQIQSCMEPYIKQIYASVLGVPTSTLPPSSPYHLVVEKGKVQLICDNQNHLAYKGPRSSLSGRYDFSIDGHNFVAETGDQIGDSRKGPVITVMEAQENAAVFDVRCK